MTGTTSLGFIYPTDPDPMCAAPGLPAKTALQVLAESIQAWITAQDLDDQIAASVDGVHRAQVSRASVVTAPTVAATTFDTVDFNFGTPTDLSVWDQGPIVSDGVWLLFAETVVEKSTQVTQGNIFGSGAVNFPVSADANGATPDPAGGGAQAAELVAGYSPQYIAMQFSLQGPAVTVNPNLRYMSVAAVRISELI